MWVNLFYYAILSRFQLFCDLHVFSAKSVVPKFQSSQKIVFFLVWFSAVHVSVQYSTAVFNALLIVVYSRVAALIFPDTDKRAPLVGRGGSAVRRWRGVWEQRNMTGYEITALQLIYSPLAKIQPSNMHCYSTYRWTSQWPVEKPCQAVYGSIEFSRVQYSIVQQSIVEYSIVQYSRVQQSTVQYSIVQYSRRYGVQSNEQYAESTAVYNSVTIAHQHTVQ